MKVYTGTSGFSYSAWRGSFYPEKIKSSEMLAHYATRLRAVEINNTFYRMPNASSLEKWADQVPEDFRFALKMSRRVTHQGRLKDVADSVRYFMDTAAELGSRLGPVLVQLPPYLRVDVERLQAFLASSPKASRMAFEFRHESWNIDEVYACLSEHGAAGCWADVDDAEGEPPPATAGWGYLRLRRSQYSDSDLQVWAERIRVSSFKEVFVFFKHEDGAAGARYAEQLISRLDSA